jgi:Domain of unknown function (DUF4383)
MSSSPNRVFGIVLGLIFFAFGIFGFFLTSDTVFDGAQGPALLGVFDVNPLLNLVHIVFGIALLLSGLIGPQIAKLANLGFGALFGVLGVLGIGMVAAPSINFLAINGGDIILHFAAAVVLLAVGLGADREAPKPKPVA